MKLSGEDWCRAEYALQDRDNASDVRRNYWDSGNGNPTENDVKNLLCVVKKSSIVPTSPPLTNSLLYQSSSTCSSFALVSCYFLFVARRPVRWVLKVCVLQMRDL
jgi:hypothetical protein